MSLYLQDIPLPEAQDRFNQALSQNGLMQVLRKETIPLDEHAAGRVLAQAVWAKSSSPHYHASAMDGFALRAADIANAQPSTPVILGFGSQTTYLDTGDPLPPWADTVIPIEQVESLDLSGKPSPDMRHPAQIRVRAAFPPWSHIRLIGEDIIATQLVLPAGQTLRPVDLGALAACSTKDLIVSGKPVVGIIPTGNELIPVGIKAQSGQIIEFNSIVMAAQLDQWGAQPKRYPIIKDDPELIRLAIQQAACECDLILVNAGSSAGAEDYTAGVINELGEVLVHGIAVRPGHPVIIGMVKHPNQVNRRIPVLGVPGYPVSTALTMEILVEPLIAQWLGRAPYVPQEIKATLTRKITSPPGDDDYARIILGQVGDRLLAAPLSRGAGVITSLARADGITIIPSGIQGLEAGATINVRLYQSTNILYKTILAIGSHDMTLDLTAQFLSQHDRRLVSANVGSQGGLVALRRKETHLAGTHLLDPVSGEYNLSAVTQYLDSLPVHLMIWAKREQGLIVAKGNPKRIISLSDLARSDVTFINRQRGAGTRVLLDYHLEKMELHPHAIHGYEREEYTHLAVAAAVASGRADCALGITAAASAMELDFIPLYYERYDLVIPLEYFDSALLAPLLDLTQDRIFRSTLSALPGYDFSQMGELII